MRLDYGVSSQTLGVTHRFGISYRFGGFFASSRANPPVFSPLGEQAVTKFELESHTKSEPKEWILAIYDESDRVVRQFAGQSEPPAHVMWDGKDESGLPLPDGVYRYDFAVLDDLGHEILAKERTVEITTAGPQGSVPVLVQ
jgi:flagellar hook assembly protein FlgD